MTKVEAELRWTDGGQFIARAGEGPAVVIDTHGGGSGPSPMELVLMGVAGCTAIDVLLIMQKRRALVTDLEVHISGTRAEDYPRRYVDIHLEYRVYGTDIKIKDVERAIQLSEDKYCSALASLDVPYDHSFKILEPRAPATVGT